MTTLKSLVGSLNTYDFFPITPPNLHTFSLNKNRDGYLGITKYKFFKMAESSQVRKKKKEIAFFITRIDKLIRVGTKSGLGLRN